MENSLARIHWRKLQSLFFCEQTGVWSRRMAICKLVGRRYNAAASISNKETRFHVSVTFIFALGDEKKLNSLQF